MVFRDLPAEAGADLNQDPGLDPGCKTAVIKTNTIVYQVILWT